MTTPPREPFVLKMESECGACGSTFKWERSEPRGRGDAVFVRGDESKAVGARVANGVLCASCALGCLFEGLRALERVTGLRWEDQKP